MAAETIAHLDENGGVSTIDVVEVVETDDAVTGWAAADMDVHVVIDKALIVRRTLLIGDLT